MRLFKLNLRNMGILVALMAAVAIQNSGAEPFSPTANNGDECSGWVGRLVSVQGGVRIKKQGRIHWEPADLNDTLAQGDMLRVDEHGRAAVYLCNQGTVRLGRRSTITFTEALPHRPLIIRMTEGMAHFFSRIRNSINVVTPFVNGAVEGTEFLVTIADDHSLISVFEGRVLAQNQWGTLAVPGGNSMIAQAGQPPALRTRVRPRDAVQWALYFPTILDIRPNSFPDTGAGTWQADTRESISLFNAGYPDQAVNAIADAPDDIDDALFFTYRATVYLALGQTEEAAMDLDRALLLDPGNSPALAVRSVMMLVNNHKDQALALALEATENTPDSAAANIALAYAYQAHFNLDAAIDQLEAAVVISPENAPARARLAELLLGRGNVDSADTAVETAIRLNPDDAHAHTVRGFIRLTRIRTGDAVDAFKMAISKDSTAPLPRLGLGLAYIRQGDLAKGRQEIEIAVSLDPNNALIRSYLGKAFFDEKRNAKAANQLAIAKALDPNDPTPWLYDAIRKQTENRPVEALHDLRQSIRLNDNRAVYRSRFLLDEDLAVRSAGLGRIYKDLGFNQLALNEGFKSVNADPGNYSAHRFLADTYAALPRHEIARASELLQSQLLQPINSTPIQPQLAETSLFIHQGTGPSDTGFNEFTSAFNRNRVSVQANVVAGSNGSLGDDLVVSGVWDRLSFSAGQFHYESDGFRENNDQIQNIYNAFAQAALTPDTSVQMEYRYKDFDRGDLSLRFEEDNYLDNLRQNDLIRMIRGGFKHAFSPVSVFIGSAIYSEFDGSADIAETIIIPMPPPLSPLEIEQDISIELEEKSYLIELQSLIGNDYLNLITGAGYFNSESIEKTGISFAPELPPMLNNIRSDNDLETEQSYAYAYATTTPSKKILWTVGLSFDAYNDDQHDDQRLFNPKTGLIWAPTHQTTFRAAVFKTFRKQLLTDQTIEPAQIAGFNQFYKDTVSTEAWAYGAGIDHEFTDNLFGGAEFVRRDLNSPYLDTTADNRSVDRDIREYLIHSYLYWTPLSWMSAKLEYFSEDNQYDDNRPVRYGFSRLITHRVPLGIDLFHQKGYSAGFKVTYVEQSGEFGNIDTGFSHDEDVFWTADAALSYRFPKRLGQITFEARNLFDESFHYQDIDPANPQIYPEKLFALKLSLAF
ncbi:MAG: tetratricopeptide repeat protein [Desulfobacteraceae bacterium]|nr:tetratricopeptide repeat protein [Desulfobacteraceae bacterium]